MVAANPSRICQRIGPSHSTSFSSSFGSGCDFLAADSRGRCVTAFMLRRRNWVFHEESWWVTGWERLTPGLVQHRVHSLPLRTRDGFRIGSADRRGWVSGAMSCHLNGLPRVAYPSVLRSEACASGRNGRLLSVEEWVVSGWSLSSTSATPMEGRGLADGRARTSRWKGADYGSRAARPRELLALRLFRTRALRSSFVRPVGPLARVLVVVANLSSAASQSTILWNASSRGRGQVPPRDPELLREHLHDALYQQALACGERAFLAVGRTLALIRIDSMSLSDAPSVSTLSSSFVASPVPNLQAGHCAQDSTYRKRE